MPTRINVPNFGSIDFPDEMSLDDITSALRKEFPPQAASESQWVIQDTLSRLGKGVAEQGAQALQGVVRGSEIAKAQRIPTNLQSFAMQAAMEGADVSPVAPLIEKAQREAPVLAQKAAPENPFFQLGRDIEETAGQFYQPNPAYNDTIQSKLIQGVASTVPVLASGPLAPITYAGMMGETSAREAEEKGASPEKVADTFMASAALGMTSEFLLGVPYLLRSVKAIKGAGQTLSKTEIGKRLAAISVKHPVATLAARGAVAEAIQEGPIEQVGQNAIAKFVGQYDTERPIFQDVAEQAAYGAAVGLLLGGLFGAAGKIDRARSEEQEAFTFQDPLSGQWLNAADFAARQGLNPEQAHRSVGKLPTPFLDVAMEVTPKTVITQADRIVEKLNQEDENAAKIRIEQENSERERARIAAQLQKEREDRIVAATQLTGGAGDGRSDQLPPNEQITPPGVAEIVPPVIISRGRFRPAPTQQTVRPAFVGPIVEPPTVAQPATVEMDVSGTGIEPASTLMAQWEANIKLRPKILSPLNRYGTEFPETPSVGQLIGKTLTYDQLIDAPKLFEAFPALRDKPVKITRYENSFSGSNARLTTLVGDTTLERFTTHLLHELYHDIQRLSGKEAGASHFDPNYWKNTSEREARAFQKSGVAIAKSYVREGDRYVYKAPPVAAPVPAPKPITPKQQIAIDAKEFDDLLWPFGYTRDATTEVTTGLGTDAIKGKVKQSADRISARAKAFSELRAEGDPTNPADRASLLPRLKAHVEKVTAFDQNAESRPVNTLGKGDKFTIIGEPHEVIQVTADGDVMIRGRSPKRLRDEDSIQIDPGSYVAVEQSGEFTPPEPTIPKLRANENQGDIFAKQSVDLSLEQEKTTDFERIAREKAAAEQRAKEAAALAAQRQTNLTLGEPSRYAALSHDKLAKIEWAKRTGNEKRFEVAWAAAPEIFPEIFQAKGPARKALRIKRTAEIAQWLEKFDEKTLGEFAIVTTVEKWNKDHQQRAAPQQGASTVEQVTTEALAFLGVTQLPPSITIINDPSKPFAAVITNRNAITLNASKIAPGTVGKVLLEEGLHGVWFQPEVQNVLADARKAVTQADIEAERAKRTGLDEGDAALLEEATISKLLNRSFWNRMLDALKRAFMRVFGIKINPNSYEGLREAAMAFLRGKRGNLPGKRLVTANATVVAPGVSPAYAITAYHGTPHEVDRFSTDKIGTGEGAQVYGWGLYFAENPAVSAEYARKLGGSAYPSIETLRKYFKAGNIIPSYGGGRDRVISFRGDNNQDWSVQVIEVRENATGIVENVGFPRDHKTPPSASNLEAAGLRPGREYTVTLNVEQDELLDWDLPLSEQSETVKEAIRNSGASLELMALMHGSEIYRELMGGMFASDLDYLKGAARQRTERLAGLGIKGIRYLDQGSRGNQGYNVVIESAQEPGRSFLKFKVYARAKFLAEFESRQEADKFVASDPSKFSTHNFVVFNSDDITITHRNGQPVSVEKVIGEDVRYAAPTTESTTTRVLGLDEAALRRVIKPEDKIQGQRDAERLYDEAGIPWRRTPANLLVPRDLGAVTEDNLRRLIAIARRELDPVFQAGLAQPNAPFNDRRANFNNSIRVWANQMRSDIYGGRHTRLPMALFDELFAITQGEASEAGKKLYLHKEPQIDEMQRIADAPEAELLKIWQEQYDAGPVQSTLQAIRLYFQNFFNAAQIDTVLGDHPGARAFLDELLGDSVVSPKPTVQQMIQAIFATPIRRHAELGQRLVRILTDQLGIDPARANEAARIFNTAFAESIDEAWKKALAQAQNRLTPKEKSIAGPGTKLWKKLQDFVNAKGTDDYEFFREWITSIGGSPPTDADINALRAVSERAQQLLELTPRQLQEVAANPSREDAIKRQRADAEIDNIAALQKKMVTLWKRMVRPIGWTNWIPGSEETYTRAQALNEAGAGNVLSRITFTSKQGLDIGTNMLFGTPQRALAYAFIRYGNALNLVQDEAGARADLWKDITDSLGEAYSIRWKTAGARYNAVLQGLAGRGLPQNVEGIKGGVHAFDRMELRINELLKEGTPASRAKAFVYLIGSLGKLGFRVAGSLDLFQGVPLEFQDIRQQVVTELRKRGKPRAVAMQQADEVIGDIQSARALALAEARTILEESAEPGETFTDGQVSKAAWEMVKGQMYVRMKLFDLNADEFEERNKWTRNLYGWNLPIEGGIGAIPARATKGLQDWLAKAGIPTGGLGAFGNAIGTFIDRKISWLGLGFFPKMFKGSPFYGNELEIMQRKVEAGTYGPIGMAGFLLAAIGLVIVHSAWPDDPKERERWDKEGIRPNTVEIPLGDGTSLNFSTTTGPLVFIGTQLAAGGALFNLARKRAEKQAKMDAEADKKGIARSKIDPISTSEVAGVLATAAKQAMFGGRTISGIASSYSDHGKFDLNRSASSFVSSFVPGLPAYQELTRLAGVSIDPKRASFWDLFVPLPNSTARRVNMLGDDVGNPDAVQRVMGMMTGGTSIRVGGKVEDQGLAYANLFASSYRPPPLSAAKGHNFSGTFRPMNPREYGRYVEERGKAFKQELESLGALDGLGSGEARKSAQGAFQRANQRALASVGVSEVKPKRAYTRRLRSVGGITRRGRSSGGRIRRGRTPSFGKLRTARAPRLKRAVLSGTRKQRVQRIVPANF